MFFSYYQNLERPNIEQNKVCLNIWSFPLIFSQKISTNDCPRSPSRLARRCTAGKASKNFYPRFCKSAACTMKGTRPCAKPKRKKSGKPDGEQALILHTQRGGSQKRWGCLSTQFRGRGCSRVRCMQMYKTEGSTMVKYGRFCVLKMEGGGQKKNWVLVHAPTAARASHHHAA